MITPGATSNGASTVSPCGSQLNSNLSPVCILTLIGAMKYSQDSRMPCGSVTRLYSFSKNACRFHPNGPSFEGRGWYAQPRSVCLVPGRGRKPSRGKKETPYWFI